jgi:hypothetical protein
MCGAVADKDLNYLNMKEIKDFCIRVGIPFKIHYYRDGKLRVSGEIDRKSIILERIRGYVKNRDVGQATVYAKKVVCFDPLPKVLNSSDRIFYGQYKTTHKNILSLMKDLTDGKFKFGAISQEVIRDFWREEKTPTYRQFAHAWIKGIKAHTKPKPEWAYLTDLAAGMEKNAWKGLRQKKAKIVINYLHQLKE